MPVTDPIADMLTRIRNAGSARHDDVQVPRSKLKVSIAHILKREGYIEGYQERDDGPQGDILIRLKYDGLRTPIIEGLRRLSKPGWRRYVKASEVPKVRHGLGIAILSTSRGVLTDEEARKQNIGGELLCEIW